MNNLTKQLEGLYISSHKLNDNLNIELDIDQLVNNLNNLHIDEYVEDVKDVEIDELLEDINNLHISHEYKLKDIYNVQVEKTLSGQVNIKVIPKCTIEFMKMNPFIIPRFVNAF